MQPRHIASRCAATPIASGTASGCTSTDIDSPLVPSKSDVVGSCEIVGRMYRGLQFPQSFATTGAFAAGGTAACPATRVSKCIGSCDG